MGTLDNYSDEEMRKYVRYCQECEGENLEPHTFPMWRVHGRPEGPLG